MPITFYTQSRKEIAPIYIRIRERDIDAKARTLISVPQDRFVNSQIQLHRLTTSSNPEDKVLTRQKNDALNSVQVQIDTLRRNVQIALNERGGDTFINSNWLKNIVQPKVENNTLVGYIDVVIELKKNRKLSKNTIDTYKTLKSIVLKYQAYIKQEFLVTEIDNNFINGKVNGKKGFITYLTDKGYRHNTKIMYVRTIKTILAEAKKMGVKVCEYRHFLDGFKKEKTHSVYLTFKEIETLFKLEGLTPQEDIARDWLVISCNTAQRVGDLLNFKKKDIVYDGELAILNVKQQKTKTPIQVPLHPQVISILKKYKGNFPPPLNDNEITNYIYYNTLIKQVCKKAGFNDEVKTLTHHSKGNSQLVNKLKWECVTSHIGRRSFATNYYGKMHTANVMSVTGHLTESSFLLYINKARERDVRSIAKDMLAFSS